MFVLAALALVSCAPDSDQADAGSSAAPGEADVRVEAREMAYEPSRLEVSAGESLSVELVNGGSLRHDLVLDDGTESGTLNAGESTTLDLEVHESTVAWCSVPGHRNAGMELSIDVVED